MCAHKVYTCIAMCASQVYTCIASNVCQPGVHLHSNVCQPGVHLYSNVCQPGVQLHSNVCQPGVHLYSNVCQPGVHLYSSMPARFGQNSLDSYRYLSFRKVFLYLIQPRLTLIFDLVTPTLTSWLPRNCKSTISCPSLQTTCANLHQNWFICFQNIMFTSLETAERDKWTSRKDFVVVQSRVAEV